MNHEERERQLFILGKSFNLIGAKGDTYFEEHLDKSGLAERDIVNILAATIKEDDWVLDVGANIGYVSLAMSVLCSRGKVFAFEPAPAVYELLQKNILLNKATNIKINEFGLSDSKSSAKLTYSLSNSSGAFVNDGVVDDMKGLGSDTIKLKRLDTEYKHLGITKCSLMKVDVEGHEPNFLRGASAFIKKFKPEALMEVNQWCLNVFNRTSLPDFIDLSYEHFPHIFAFHEGNYLDLSDDSTRYVFYYENAVNGNYTNVYCGFNRNEMLARLNLAFGKARQLSFEKQELENQVHSLEEQISVLRNSRPQKAAAKINTLLGR